MKDEIETRAIFEQYKTLRDSRGRRARPSVQYAGSFPTVETNPDIFDPWTTLGSGAYDLGLYYQLRYTDPVIEPAMEFLQSRVKAFPVGFEPPADATDAELRCLAFVREFAAECIQGELESVVAGVFDAAMSYGFQARERIIEDYPGHRFGIQLRLFRIDGWSISQWDTNANDTSILRGIRQNQGEYIPAHKLLYYGFKPSPGAWVGMSRLRPFFASKVIIESLLQSLIERARTDKGVPVVKETMAADAVKGNVDDALEFCLAYMEGDPTPIYLPHTHEVEMFSPGPSAISNPVELMQYFDSQRRAALYQSLENVGVSTGGNRALGEEFRISDNDKFGQALRDFERAMNGGAEDIGALCELPAYIASIGGFYGCRPPLLSFKGLGRVDVRDKLGEIRSTVKDGIDLALDDKDIESIRPALGLRDRTEEEDRDTAQEAEPLSSGQVSAAAEIIALVLRQEMPFESGVVLLRKLGFTKQEAEKALSTESGIIPPAPAENPVPAEASLASRGCGAPLQAAGDAPPRPSLNNRRNAGPAEQAVDWDKLERRVERAIGGTVRDVQDVSRAHRDAFVTRAQPMIDAADLRGLSTLEVDWTDFYAEELRASLEKRGIALGEMQAEDEIKQMNGEPESQPLPEGPTLQERIDAIVMRLAEDWNDEANNLMRTRAMNAADEGNIQPLLAFLLPVTVATAGASAALMEVANRAHERKILRDGPLVERCQILEVMDRNTCGPCAAHDGIIVEIGSKAYRKHYPPYSKCESTLGPRGNRCRGWVVYLDEDLYRRVREHRKNQ